MDLLVLGATGRTGGLVVRRALACGHRVAALCRDPARLPADLDVARVAGDARDVDALLPAFAGRDAVVSALAADTLGPSTVASEAALACVRAARRAGSPRLVVTSSRSIVATRPRLAVALTWWWFREPYRDLARAEGVLQGADDLDWRIVRAVMLADGPGKGRYHLDRAVDATGGDWRLDRADYAEALLDVAEDDALVRTAVGVGGA
ncbi:MAG: NAD(P)H-binding protein [Myxococcota bacterium]